MPCWCIVRWRVVASSFAATCAAVSCLALLQGIPLPALRRPAGSPFPWCHPSLTSPQDASWDAADVSGQPWYFGASLDLSVLGPATLPMECGSSAACDEDDDIPLLTLDLGGEASVALQPGGRAVLLLAAVGEQQWQAAKRQRSAMTRGSTARGCCSHLLLTRPAPAPPTCCSH